MHASSEEPEGSPAGPGAPAPGREHRPRRRRRGVLPRGRWARVVLALVCLLVVLAVATQVVLWTNVPRDLVLTQLQKQLGLRVRAASLSTGWLGDTRLRDVTIALPLSDESLVRVPRMRVKHNSLFGLLWTRAVTIDRIELHGPHLVVRQDAAGRWNLQQVADLVARTGGKQAAADQAAATPATASASQSRRPKLPAVRVVNATVDVVDRGGRTTTVAPVNVDGEPEDVLTWKYDVTAGPRGAGTTTAATTATTAPAGPPQMRLVGRVAVGGTWAHEVRLYATRVEGWARPWAGDAAPAVSMLGEWRGQLRGGGVVGRLVIDALDVGATHTAGSLGVGTEGGGVVALRPQDVLVRTPQTLVPELRITGGRLVLDGTSVAADALSVLSSDGAARVDGRLDWAAGSAEFKAAWSDFAVPGQRVVHGGSLTASLRHPFPGQPVLSAQLVSNGRMPAATWEADLSLGGSGTSWSNVDWEFRANRLALSGKQPLRLAGLAASVQTRGSVVSLVSLKGPGSVVASGDGQYDLASKDWNFRLDLSNLPRPMSFGRQGPIALTLNAHGTAERIVFEKPGLSIRGTEAQVRADGTYDFTDRKPVKFKVYVNHIPSRSAASPDQPPIFGYLRGEAEVTGTVYPRDLDVVGNLVGRDLRFFDRSIGDIEAGLTGRVDERHTTLRTSRLQLLGGHWQLDALFPEQGVLGMNLSVENLPLAELGGAIKQPGLEGTVDARWAFIVPRLDPDAVTATGNLTGKNIKVGKFAADLLEATVVVADGSLTADPIRARKGQGQADLAAELDVRQYRRATATLALAAWPFEPSPGTRAELWGGTTGLRVTLPGAVREERVRDGVYRPETRAERLWVTGPIDLRAALTLKDQPLGDVSLLADMRGRAMDLRSLSFDGLDGTVQGQGVVDFDRPLEMRGTVFFEDFNADRIAEFFPENDALVGLAGRFSGRATIAPAPTTPGGPRPLEPLRVQVDVTSNRGKYRSIDVGAMRFSAFTNLDRFVLQDSPNNPSTIALAGGSVHVWGRLSVLEPGDELNPATGATRLLLSQLQVRFQSLDLDQVVHAFAPDADPMPGRLSGSFQALASTRPERRAGQLRTGQGLVEKVIRRITADGHVDVTDSDLVNFDVVGGIYQRLGLATGEQDPRGFGGVSFHLEDGLLSLNNARYFNRGTELRGIANIDQVWLMPTSPLNGTAVGTSRPLRDLRLPFLSTYDLDAILALLQANLTTVGLGGTVRDPDVRPLAFEDLGQGMRNFILGDYQQERRTAGGARR